MAHGDIVAHDPLNICSYVQLMTLISGDSVRFVSMRCVYLHIDKLSTISLQALILELYSQYGAVTFGMKNGDTTQGGDDSAQNESNSGKSGPVEQFGIS